MITTPLQPLHTILLALPLTSAYTSRTTTAVMQEMKPCKEVRYPTFRVLRYDKDESTLKAIPKGERSLYQKFKYLPITSRGKVWLSFGGPVKDRVEIWDNYSFGIPSNDYDTFNLLRGQAHTNFHITPYLRAFGEAISAWATDRSLPGYNYSLL